MGSSSSDRKHTTKLLLETLEDRLNLSWSSVAPAILKPPATAATIVQNAFGDAHGVDGIDDNEVDWYQFIAMGTGATVFKASTPGSTLNTVMAVYNAQGARMGLSDNISPTNTDSQITVNLVKGKQYWFGITNLNNTDCGSYSWSLNGIGTLKLPNDDIYENNDTRSQAANLGTITGERTFSKLVMLDGSDWYRFTLAKPAAVDGSATIYYQSALGDLDLELYNNNGGFIGVSSTGGDSESISLAGLGVGTYYVRVVAFNGAINPEYSMTLAPQLSQGAAGFNIQLRMTGISLQQQAAFKQAADRWQQIITSDLPNVLFNGINVDDLLIDASAVAIDGVNGILGQAAPDSFRSGSSLPYHGFMEFDTADLAAMQANGSLVYTVMHEIGHILGIGTLWEKKGLLFGPGTSDPLFVGTQATAAYNSIFNKNAFGVPVENGGGQGTRDSHWRESLLENELMTGYLNNGINPVSLITVASLADLGYTVNLNKADNYTPNSSIVTSNISGTSSALRMALTASTSPSLVLQVPFYLVTSQVSKALEITSSANSPTRPNPTDTVFLEVATRPNSHRSVRLVESLLNSSLGSSF